MQLDGKLVKEYVDDDNGYQYLPKARNVLRELRRIAAPFLDKIYIVDNVTVRIEKRDVVDRIYISGQSYTWVAFSPVDGAQVPGSNNIFYLTQLAYTNKAIGPWTEKPAVNGPYNFGINGYSDSYVDRDVVFTGTPTAFNKNQLGNVQYLSATGNNNWTTFSGVALTFRKQKQVTWVAYPISYSTNNDFFPFTVAGYRFLTSVTQLIWAKNPRRNNTITLQGVVFGPTTNTRGFPSLGVGYGRYAQIFVVYDVYYSRAIYQNAGDTNSIGAENVVVDGQIAQAWGYHGGNYDRPVFIFLTPQRAILQNCASNFVDGSTPALIHRYIITTTDCCNTWTTTIPYWGNAPHLSQGPYDGVFTVNPMHFAALNSNYALRVSDFEFGDYDPNAGTGTSDYAWAVHMVGIDGTETLLKRYPSPFSSSGSLVQAGVFGMRIYAIGKNAFVLQLTYLYLDNTTAVMYSRSFDAGVTWDDPVDSGWELFGYASRATHVIDNQQTLPGILYPHDPYVPGGDPGKIYVPVTQYIHNVAAAPTQTDVIPLPTQLMVSTDQCRTFTLASVMSHKKYPHTSFGQQNPSTLAYDNVLDSETPIDPIFPWRLDERVTPPDWW